MRNDVRLYTVAGLVLILGSTLGARIFFERSLPNPSTAIHQDKRLDYPAISVILPAPDRLHALAPEDAVQENIKRNFASRSDRPANPFWLRTDAQNHERAVKCLAEAVYYEAAGEGLDGGRGVAQIVLNRVRHPAYPSTICGVIYEGSERETGCQFTFTCDGSLARAPMKSLWAQANRIAAEALAGKVFGPVGHSTHYHANYVLPYWADSLDKMVQVGRHIFYRLQGTLGAASTFRQRHAGVEQLQGRPGASIGTAAITEATDILLAEVHPDLSTVRGNPPAGREVPTAILLADVQSGRLMLDEDAPPPPRKEPKISGKCKGSGVHQLQPLAANDASAQKADPAC